MPRNNKKPTRRGNKEGSIYQRTDGSWCGQVLLGYNELGKQVRKTFYGKTREEVSQRVSEATHKVFSGNLTPAAIAECPFSILIKAYLWLFKELTVSDVTFEWYLNLCNTHIIPEIGHLAIRDVKPVVLQAFINKLYVKKKLALRSVKGVRALLKQAFVHAVEMELTDSNPVTGTKLPKASRAKSEQEENAAGGAASFLNI